MRCGMPEPPPSISTNRILDCGIAEQRVLPVDYLGNGLSQNLAVRTRRLRRAKGSTVGGVVFAVEIRIEHVSRSCSHPDASRKGRWSRRTAADGSSDWSLIS